MKKNIIIAALIVFTAFVWLMTFTESKDETAEYVANLKARAAKNEEAGLYKQNLAIYNELLKYEQSEEVYLKVKDVYAKLGKTSEYSKMCSLILEYFPDSVDNTKEMFKSYDEAGKTDTIINLYTNSLGESTKADEEIKAIYLKNIFKSSYATDPFQNVEQVWDGYMLIKNAEGKYSYAYGSGSYAFSNSFDKAYVFIDDYAAVKNNGEWFFIDKEGDKYFNIPQQDYDEVQSISESLAVVVKDGKYGYIDYLGNEYNIQYDYATAMRNGVAAVKEGESWYIINDQLEKISEAYDDVVINEANICCLKERIAVKKDGACYILDTSGNRVTDTAFEDAKLYGEDGLAAVKSGGKWGFADMDGNITIECQYEDADSFNKGFAPVKTDGYYEYIYLDGTVKTSMGFEQAYRLNSAGYGLVLTDMGYQVITFKLCTLQQNG